MGITAQLYAMPEGFVDLRTVDPSIVIALRYAGSENFMGKPVIGYEKNQPILTLEAANALKKVQAEVHKQGYSLVVYEAYRPQRASQAFKAWSMDMSES
ncbi:MAG TPA: M15 family metallopeptidase, partial [Gammaproteobacteria bacterium]|nr:M15 family metallopeptidase [Gammaproteobacteria bacterium]